MSSPEVAEGEKLPVISTNDHFCSPPSIVQQSNSSEQEEKEMRIRAEANSRFFMVFLCDLFDTPWFGKVGLVV
ncbi:hypothetical protein AWN68_13265 [Roseivirga echinicomitans]|uniref:Uncharacterized protein n=1 Tax=Roseivirga echinicomitans TaxID=296218 RepID=A0A150XVV5_9BACT|nr:hypothetical protein AWN68_13265 [Roseivirga echinicomitans]